MLALRNKTGKPDFTGMAFIGIRASESLARSEYDYISLGEKHKGQYSCNPILEWNSAELYTYIYSENFPGINRIMTGMRLIKKGIEELDAWFVQEQQNVMII